MSIQEDIQKAIANNELYNIRDTVPADWQQAFDSYLELAKLGNSKAQFNLGYMFARGDLMERDYAKAFEWYQKAADNGDPRAHYNLSKMYELGEFVPPNNIKAQEHLKLAVDLGDIRATVRTSLANAKEALKQGDRDKARSLFSSIAAENKEAEAGVIACNVVFKSVYVTHIKYSYHASGSEGNKKFWKWGEAVITEVDLTMTNTSHNRWPVLVKALIRAGDGFVNISNIGGHLKAGEILSTIIDPEEYGNAKICGVAVYSDREGSVDKPIYSLHFPDVSIQPDEAEKRSLQGKIEAAQAEMERHNKTAKPGPCFVLTACYGSYDAPTVLAFRQFRDTHLARYTLGRLFIQWYYSHGPKWAEFIENKPRIRAALRRVFNLLAKILP